MAAATRGSSTRRPGPPWWAIALALLWPAVEAIRIVADPVHEVVFGDFALFEMAAQRAWHLGQLLGPNAHAGFNHPGPAMFYLLAPAVRLLSPGPGLYLGAVLINASALLAIVLVMGKRAGPQVALWTAAALNLFCLAVGPDTLRQPSNPLLLIVPMMLFVALWAGAVTQVAGAWLWAAVVGSFEIQTHLSAAVFVTVMLLLAGLLALGAMLRRPSPRLPHGWWRRPARVSGMVAVALIWLPSTVELFVDHPNNWNTTWQWVHHGHNPGIAVNTSLGIVLRSVAIFPFSHRRWTLPLPASRGQEVAAWLILAAGVALVAWLVRGKQWFAAALAGAAILAVPLGTITVSHAGGDNFGFLTAWLAFVPYVLLLSLGVGLLPGVGRLSNPGWTWARGATPRLALAAAAVICASGAVVADLQETSLATLNFDFGRATSFVRDAQAQLKPGDHWVGVLIVSGIDWEVAAGVVLELQRLGYHTFVDPRDEFLFGQALTHWTHPVQVLLTFYVANNEKDARNSLGTPVSTARGTVMNAWRPYG